MEGAELAKAPDAPQPEITVPGQSETVRVEEAVPDGVLCILFICPTRSRSLARMNEKY